ncbi:hypothetical protein CI109_105067 [Kwoniella shandongensis]|uniref:Uncharacterized protein n=1 Tax=Kwoniella shandongensis TaxID=1734106 RepID=A0A5M6BX28_9TREE|nr:uncharacterized protein CI109_004333 [Kwoniella shandongensis]KAA5527273.1 hypothetical protein CI109_004333 [Kwoniella shandongensis]
MDAGLAHLVSWSEPTRGEVPPPLTGPSLTLSPLPSPHPPTVFLFGGKSVQTRRLTADMWAMDLSTRTWERVNTGPGPGPRYFHSMDVWEDKLVCFGGMSDSDPMSVHEDTWFFDCLTRRWLPQPAPSSISQNPALLPSARYAHLSAVSRGKLIISGGQHSDNSWIYEINVYDLKNRVWESKTEQPEMGGLHSKGAYRSVATSSKTRVVLPHGSGEVKSSSTHSYSVDEEGEGGDIWCYSNYDFAKVRREFEVISPDLSSDASPSDKHVSPPSFVIRDESSRMRGSQQPPGLRFPTGGIVGNHFILCGLYLASSSAAFSIWALNLDTRTWRHLEPSALNSGSWNRAVLWPEQAKLLVFGNSDYDLAVDYSRRAVNSDHVTVISLEAYGIYSPPKLEIPAKIQQVGLSMLDEKLASDFEVVSDDGRRVKCSKQILSERWPWFAEQEKELREKAAGILRDAPAVDINDTLLGSFTPARLAPSNLTLPEPFPVCVALVQYFYTLSLSTPLQNRAPVLSALLFLSKQYKIARLNRLVVHALHERLEPSIAVGIYEIATLAGEQCLQVRALNMVHSAKSSSSSRNYRQGPSSATAGEGDHSSAQTHHLPAVAQQSTNGTSTSVGGTSGLGSTDEGTFRRARADSITLPADKPVPEGNSPRQDEGVFDDPEEDQVHALLSALDVNGRQSTPTPRPNALYFDQSRRRASDDPTGFHPTIPNRHPSRLAMPLPLSTHNSSSSLRPRTPDFSHVERTSHRPSSPTNSDVTSNYPSTPADSLRESWILPTRDFGSSAMDSRSSTSSGLMGLPSLPESGQPFDSRRSRSGRGGNRDALVDPLKQGKRLDISTLEAAGLLPPNTSPMSPGHSQKPTDSVASYYFDHASSGVSVSRTPSSTSSPRKDRTRQYSITTQSSNNSISASTQREMKLGSINLSSPTSTEHSEELRIPLMRATTGLSSVNDTASISSGSTGTSSKKAAKAELKSIQAAEKAAKKAEQHARFEQLRAEQARKMAISKAEAQRRADIQANEQLAKEREEMILAKTKAGSIASSNEGADGKLEKKSKWGKIGKGFTDAVLFPTAGSKSSMF